MVENVSTYPGGTAGRSSGSLGVRLFWEKIQTLEVHILWDRGSTPTWYNSKTTLHFDQASWCRLDMKPINL
jgi:hypothetical protein